MVHCSLFFFFFFVFLLFFFFFRFFSVFTEDCSFQGSQHALAMAMGPLSHGRSEAEAGEVVLFAAALNFLGDFLLCACRLLDQFFSVFFQRAEGRLGFFGGQIRGAEGAEGAERLDVGPVAFCLFGWLPR